jgi:hypothetical protein
LFHNIISNHFDGCGNLGSCIISKTNAARG